MNKKKLYHLKDIYKYYYYSDRTFHRHLAKLRSEKKFIKTSVGTYLNHIDAQELCRLLKIDHPDFKINDNY